MEARLEGPTLTVEDLLGLREGQVLAFDLPLTKPVELMVNGARKFTAQAVSMGKKRACQVAARRVPPGQGSTSDEPRSGG